MDSLLNNLLNNTMLLITKQVGDMGRLNHIKQTIECNRQLYNSDRKYLNDLIEKYLFLNNDEKIAVTSKKIVESINLEYINNFCIDCGGQILESDQFCIYCNKTIPKTN